MPGTRWLVGTVHTDKAEVENVDNPHIQVCTGRDPQFGEQARMDARASAILFNQTGLFLMQASQCLLLGLQIHLQ